MNNCLLFIGLFAIKCTKQKKKNILSCHGEEAQEAKKSESGKKKKKKNITIYDKRNAFSLQQKETVLIAFRISKLRDFKNLGPWKLIENFLILVLH